MIEKGIDGEPDKKHTCYPLGKQITLQTINRLKQKQGYRNSHIVYYKTRIPNSPAEATLTGIDFDVDAERMKKIHEEEIVIRLVVSRELIPINHTMAITPLKSKSVYTQADDDDKEEIEECDLDEYKLWLAEIHQEKNALGKIWYNPIFVYLYS
jgi:ABC-type cobalt transport system substrate-binding protein